MNEAETRAELIDKHRNCATIPSTCQHLAGAGHFFHNNGLPEPIAGVDLAAPNYSAQRYTFGTWKILDFC